QATVCSRVLATDRNGLPDEIAPRTPVPIQTEPVEYLPLAAKFSELDPQEQRLFPPLAFVLLVHAAVLVLRQGWRGLRFPVVAYLAAMVVPGLLPLFESRGTHQPWQRCGGEGGASLLFQAMVLAGIATLVWLAVVGVARLVLWLGRRLFLLRGKASSTGIGE